MDSLKMFSKKERYFFAIGAIVVLLLLFFITPYGKKILSGKDSVFNSTPEIGKIVSQTNETKHRPYKEITWNTAKRNQVVHGGDAVLTGEKSSMHVELNKGEKISLGENSLLVFDLIDKQEVVNLQDGNFSLKVNGSVKIAIKGEITEINGQQSEVQIFMDKKTKAPQVKLLSGSGAKITKKNKKPIIINTRAVANIPMQAKEVESEKEIEVIPEKAPEPVVIEIPKLQTTVNKISYNWKLYDLYEQKDSQLYQKKYRPTQVRTNANLSWSLKKDSPVKVQLSNTGLFSTEAVSFLASDKSLNLANLFIGQNFLRASVDTVSWSPVEKIYLEAQFLDNAEPVVKSETDRIPLVKEGTTVITNVQLTPKVSNPLGYIVEASKTPDFALGSTRTFWSKNSNVKLSFYKEGDYYYRFKSVNASEELSKWSDPIKFFVFMTKAPDAPRLTKVKTDGFVGEKFNLAWNSTGVRTRVEIRNIKNQKVKEFIDDKIVWTPKTSGQYKVQAWTVNEYGQESEASRSVKLNVKDIPVEKKPVVAELPPKKEVAPVKTQERAVSSVETNTVTEKIIIKKESDEISSGWEPSQFSVGSFFRTLQSSQQYSINDTSLSTNGVMAHGYYWKDTDGFEAYAKASATGAADESGATNSIKDLEARYHYRFRKALFGLEGLQTSIFTGYEMYRNTGFLFSSQYDLFKFGTALQLALPRQFTIGGELAFGLGTDQSTSFESIGNVNYLFSKNWSLGLGYGVHLFEAKSTKSSAQGVLPYREGYTEGLSTLNYRF